MLNVLAMVSWTPDSSNMFVDIHASDMKVRFMAKGYPTPKIIIFQYFQHVYTEESVSLSF